MADITLVDLQARVEKIIDDLDTARDVKLQRLAQATGLDYVTVIRAFQVCKRLREQRKTN